MNNEKIRMSNPKLSIRLVALLVSSHSAAECYVVDNLQGWSVRARDNYELIDDGFSQDKFYLNFGQADDDSWMSNDPNRIKIPCVNDGVLVCVDRRYADAVLTWSIDTESRKVAHTRTQKDTGFSDGASMMIGDLISVCED